MHKKTTFSVLLLLFCTTLLTAQVGIGTIDPAPGALLDIEGDGGILIPRVALTSTTSQLPISPPAPTITVGVMVFNTATINDVTPGFYYWNGSAWERMAVSDEAANNWGLAGNDATGSNFLGTTNAQPLAVRTGNTERMRITPDGEVIINGTVPDFPGDKLTVYGNSGDWALNSYTSNGTGIYGLNNGGPGWGLLGESTSIGVEGWGGLGVWGESPIDNGFGMRAVNTNTSGTGLLAIGNNLATSTYLTSGTGIAANGNNGILAYGRTAAGTGLIAVGNNNPNIWTYGGTGVAATGNAYGVFGTATNTSGDRFGGIFTVIAPGPTITAQARVGGFVGSTLYKIIGDGAVSTIVKDTEDKPVIMFAPEAPEILFQDYGIGHLVNGRATIILDPILVKNIRVDENHPLKVFIQLEGDCNGVYVTNKSANGFEVRELQGGTSNVPFAWTITATRADEKLLTDQGEILISKNNVRFPTGPDPIKVEKNELSVAEEITPILPKSEVKRSRLSKN